MVNRSICLITKMRKQKQIFSDLSKATQLVDVKTDYNQSFQTPNPFTFSWHPVAPFLHFSTDKVSTMLVTVEDMGKL